MKDSARVLELKRLISELEDDLLSRVELMHPYEIAYKRKLIIDYEAQIMRLGGVL